MAILVWQGTASLAVVGAALSRAWPNLSSGQMVSILSKIDSGGSGGSGGSGSGGGLADSAVTFACVLDFLVIHCRQLITDIDERTTPLSNTFAEPPAVPPPPAPPLVHPTPISQMLSLPTADRRKIFSHSSDGTLCLWYARTLRPSATFKITKLGRTVRPLCAAYLEADRLVAVGGVDRYIYLYDCEPIDAAGGLSAVRCACTHISTGQLLLPLPSPRLRPARSTSAAIVTASLARHHSIAAPCSHSDGSRCIDSLLTRHSIASGTGSCRPSHATHLRRGWTRRVSEVWRVATRMVDGLDGLNL